MTFRVDLDLSVNLKSLGITIPRGWRVRASIIPTSLTDGSNPHDYSYSTTDRYSYGTDWTFGNVVLMLETDDGSMFANEISDIIGIGSRKNLSYVSLHNKLFIDSLIEKLIDSATKKLAKLQAVKIGRVDANSDGKDLENRGERRVRRSNSRKPTRKIPVN